MKKFLLSAPLFAALAISAPAHADTTPGYYLGAGAGLTMTPDAKTSTGAGDVTAEFKDGWNAAASGGYAWANGWRAEAELFRSSAVVHSLNRSGSANSGSLTNTDMFVNGLYDFNLGSMFTPYVGAGVGFAVPDTTNVGTLANGGAYDDTDLQFAYQAIAGVSAQVTPHWAVTADYRYVASLDPTFKTTVGGTGEMENASHNVLLGVRYSFGAPATVPMAKTTAPELRKVATTKPAVAPVAQTYEVFFDFDKATLTPEAKKILGVAAQDYVGGKYVKIVVTGHTDTVGTAAYNKGLSQRRAQAVKKELASLGVTANAVSIRGMGKDSLLVPTADGVREAQNRRAEIVFKAK